MLSVKNDRYCVEFSLSRCYSRIVQMLGLMKPSAMNRHRMLFILIVVHFNHPLQVYTVFLCVAYLLITLHKK